MGLKRLWLRIATVVQFSAETKQESETLGQAISLYYNKYEISTLGSEIGALAPTYMVFCASDVEVAQFQYRREMTVPTPLHLQVQDSISCDE